MEKSVVSVKTELEEPRYIKCVAWDLDNTLWDGVLLEDEQVYLKEEVRPIIEALDSRGILQSVASRNEHHTAMAKLREFGLDQYLLYPQINWNSKASSLKAIAQAINISLDSIAFVDDQPFEREEVSFSLPEVLCIDTADLNSILDRPEMNPRFKTEDARMRRLMYLSDIERQKAEAEFVGPQEEFLETLGMTFTIAVAQEDDLQRAEELTVRTHQLNTTGYTYSYDELNFFRQSDHHILLVSSLEDKFGNYGKIGLALVACEPEVWTIKLLLMSCRVMSRGVGTVMLSYIMRLAKQAGVRLEAEFVSNERNRMMYITYKFAGFKERAKVGEMVIFTHDLSQLQPFPTYLQVRIVDSEQ